jgi:nitroimidazol reductase NimA-like FMN-containing flavoprotein (pyridoxamine 5'-phosphate oxidase superfamily)
MNETPEDLERLQRLLDESYAAGGPHLLEVITPERRMDAASLAARLDGMKLLVLATVTGDGRPICGPVDGIFYRGSFHFGSSPESIRFRHIRQRPAVSATHLDGEEFSVTVHGTATEIDLKSSDHADFRRALLDVYVPRYGAGWEQFIDSGPVYARIDAHRMFTFFMPADTRRERGRTAISGPGVRGLPRTGLAA